MAAVVPDDMSDADLAGARGACVLTIVLAAPALLLTLTRGVWIGASVGALVAMLVAKRAGPYLVTLVVTVALALGWRWRSRRRCAQRHRRPPTSRLRFGTARTPTWPPSVSWRNIP